MKNIFRENGKKITVYTNDDVSGPVPHVFINEYAGDGSGVWKELENKGAFCALTVISDVDWDNDLTPWECPPVFPGDGTYKGKADEHCDFITGTVIPKTDEMIGEKASYYASTGYSLAGLFALYTAYRSDVFSRFASMSGSLWYPGFIEFAQEHDFSARPDFIYLSLGDREAKTRNATVSKVQENTEKYYELIKQAGIASVLQMNPGNHYKDIDKRTAAGIMCMLKG